MIAAAKAAKESLAATNKHTRLVEAVQERGLTHRFFRISRLRRPYLVYLRSSNPCYMGRANRRVPIPLGVLLPRAHQLHAVVPPARGLLPRATVRGDSSTTQSFIYRLHTVHKAYKVLCLLQLYW